MQSYTAKTARQLAALNSSADIITQCAALEREENKDLVQSAATSTISLEELCEFPVSLDTVNEMDTHVTDTVSIYGGGVLVKSAWGVNTGYAFRRSLLDDLFAHMSHSMTRGDVLLVTLSTDRGTKRYQVRWDAEQLPDRLECAALWRDSHLHMGVKPDVLSGFVTVYMDSTCKVLSSMQPEAVQLLIVQLNGAARASSLPKHVAAPVASRAPIGSSIQCMLGKLKLQYSTN